MFALDPLEATSGQVRRVTDVSILRTPIILHSSFHGRVGKDRDRARANAFCIFATFKSILMSRTVSRDEVRHALLRVHASHQLSLATRQSPEFTK